MVVTFSPTKCSARTESILPLPPCCYAEQDLSDNAFDSTLPGLEDSLAGLASLPHLQARCPAHAGGGRAGTGAVRQAVRVAGC